MKKTLLALTLLLSLQSFCQQTIMRIHQKDQNVLEIPIANIDSITHYTESGSIFNSLVTKINQDAELSYIKSAIGIAGLTDTLSKAGTNFTFFAPVNASLDSLTYDGMSYSKLLTDTVNGYSAEYTRKELRYHIIQGKYRSADVPADAENLKLMTINTPADSVFVTKTQNGSIYVNGKKVDDAKKDITTDNGIIHKLVSDNASREYGYLELPINLSVYDLLKQYTGRGDLFDSIVKMIDRAATVDPTLIPALKNNRVTIAAPLNSALVPFIKAAGGDINKIPAATIESVLKNHIIADRKFVINFVKAVPAGGITTMNGQKLKYKIATFDGGIERPVLYIVDASDKWVPVLANDFMCRNGVLHIISGVILDK
jgi:uncharacterized surface protein with fasciclin (FAS1) repeats